MKILVADDSRTMLSLLVNSLKKLGHEVTPAISGVLAIEKFKQERPDLIILDVVMEGIDGFECARRIRAINSDDWIPIIFLSATVDDENISNGINAGGDDYLTKPYSEITLAAKIKAMQRIADMRNKLFDLTKKLAALSSTDSLTNLNNRMQFDKTIIEKISQANRTNRAFTLLLIDLDKFKIINDTLGHYIGDLLLIEVAKRLKLCLRLEDFVARLGGDEFGILLLDVFDTETGSHVAKKIINHLNAPYNLAGHELNIGCSIGLAIYVPEDHISLETLIKNADIAMYHAKETGRNNYKYFSAEIYHKHHAQVEISKALKAAIDKNELVLTYQPIFNLKTKQIVRMEALTTWYNPQFGRVSASVFIPLAEEHGLIDILSVWIIENTIYQSREWFMKGYRFKVSINISPRQLLQKNLHLLISDMLQKVKLPPKYFELELTETSPLIYSNLYEDVLSKLHKMGISLSLDDFGTAYSSLSHLRTLPINAIKIDRNFIKDIQKINHDAMLVKSLIVLGRNLGFDVIAEGIETAEQLHFLIENDCPQGQGYYLCRPKEGKDISQMFNEHKFIPVMG